MHEFSVTIGIVKTVIQAAEHNNAKKIKSVKLLIGKLTHLSKDQVMFCYEVLIKDTILENSELLIQTRNPKVYCSNCQYKGKMGTKRNQKTGFPTFTLACPKCGEQTKIIEGLECTIKGIRVEK